MNLFDVESKLNELFECDENRIIIWFDSEKDFVEDLKSLNIDAQIIFLDESPVIETKYLIESSEDKYLIYTNKENVSLEGNFFGDILSYAYRFSADKISILLADLEIPNDFRDTLSRYSKFFNAKGRINDFKRLNIKHYSDDNICLGVICAALKETTLKFEFVLRKVLNEGFDDNKYLNLLEKYDLDDDFWSLTKKFYYFNDKNPTLFKLFSSMILTYTNIQFSRNFPTSLNSYILADENNIPVFLDNFMNNPNYKNSFNELSDIVNEKLNLKEKFKNNQVDDYLYCDAFRLFDQNIIKHYVDLLNVNKHEININVNKFRKTTHYYPYYKDYYMLIDYANKFIGVINRFEDEILSDDINILIKLFIEKYSSIDKFYRKFYYHYDKLNQEFKEYDKLEELRNLIENMYSNIFLDKINNKFNELLRNTSSLNEISLTKQWNFYREIVKPSLTKHKTVVIISDAFRYGNALELNKIMEMDPTRETNLRAMISTIPSYTTLSMASLLPHKSMKYKGDDVLIDGISTKGVINREKILKKYNPKAKAIQYDDIINMKRDEINTFFKDTELVYVYHNQVDARGDNDSTENEVFNAVEESLTEINDLIKKLTNFKKANHFYITSDHGFIYKRNKLEENSKVNLDDYNKYELIYKNRRFILTDTPTDIENTLSISLDYMDIDNIFVTVPFGVKIFKTKGGGMNFVHGGASLEEVITPLLYVKSKTGKSKLQKQVEIQLIDNKKKITSNITNILFFQKENISENVTPLKASVYFVDEDNFKISDENIIFADVNSENPEDREIKVKFTFQDKKYAKNQNYYLVVKDLENDIELERYNYIIDIAFQDDFDFF